MRVWLADQGGDMHATIVIERLSTSNGSYLIGAEAISILAAIEGISCIHVEKQYIDRATLSYQSNDLRQDFDRIDQMLWRKGMQRVG
ncbi:hypothetical protein [Dokdonella soli]|uniref:Uncharacterized protein n=1 Tax=Dokdonella soli TaxID=529810 RepID=A0ABP3TK05_9GAMM